MSYALTARSFSDAGWLELSFTLAFCDALPTERQHLLFTLFPSPRPTPFCTSEEIVDCSGDETRDE
jgi:hypothetical protein